MVTVEDYNEERDCIYKDEHYSVRDNGAVMRHPREGKRLRKVDNVWTFGKPNDITGYMEIAGQTVHRIVAYAFLGNPPTEQHIVDHIDTNRRNNRPDNLRWLTRLENVLNNPITRARIENLCGSIEAFLDNPSILNGHEHVDPNFSWMRTVSPGEAKISLDRLTNWAKEHPKPQGGTIGEWIFEEPKPNSDVDRGDYLIKTQNLTYGWNEMLSTNYVEPKEREPLRTQSITPNAIQIDWRIPSEFPCCPTSASSYPLEEYIANLKVGSVFCKNNIYSTHVMDSAIADEGNSLWVMTESDGESIKPYGLAKIVYDNGVFIHESKGTFFEENGAMKYFTLAQGKEWTGGEVMDDYC